MKFNIVLSMFSLELPHGVRVLDNQEFLCDFNPFLLVYFKGTLHINDHVCVHMSELAKAYFPPVRGFHQMLYRRCCYVT